MVLGLDSKVPGKMVVAEMVQMMGLLVAHMRAWVQDLGSGVADTIGLVVALVNQQNCSSMGEVV